MSVVAVLLSGLGLYWSHLRSARLEIFAGELIHLYHSSAGELRILVSVAIANHGARLGAILRFALIVEFPHGTQRYLLEPLSYQRVTDRGTHADESDPTPVPVVSRSSTVKVVLFTSSADHPEDFDIDKAGTYQFIVLAWTPNSEMPILYDRFEVQVTEKTAKRLRQKRLEKNCVMTAVSNAKWQKWSARLISKSEVAALLPKPRSSQDQGDVGHHSPDAERTMP